MSPAATALRATRPGDLPWVVEVEGLPAIRPWIHRWSAARHRAALDDPRLWHETLLDGEERRVGFAISRRHHVPAAEVEIVRLAVTRPGRGHGTRALERLLERAARRSDLARVWLDVRAGNDRARRLYERLGLRLVGPQASRPDTLLIYAIGRPELRSRLAHSFASGLK